MSRSVLTNSTVGEYRVADLLGAGGMGEVYRAVHSKIGRTVAIKVLSQTVNSPQFVERFLNEARIQASLHHPNIATLYDFLELNGQPCIVMEYVEGQTLADRIRTWGALTVPEALALFRPVVEAIGYVHSQGIVHRDVKSNNIKITSSGQVKLLDFGIAKSGSSPALTAAGGFVGTLQYLSPEQFKGGIADARSDVWALGVLLYEMVTGHMPFEADTIGQLYERVSKAAYTPPSALNASIPREVESIVGRCLKKNPADRYQSCADLLRDTERLRAAPVAPRPDRQSIPVSPRTEPRTETPTTSNRSTWLVIGGIAAALVLVILVGGWLLMNGGEGDTTIRETDGTSSGTPGRPAGSQLRRVTIDVMEGRAEVYRAGQRVGATPYQFEARPGERVGLVLRREGFEDKPVDLSVTDTNKTYTFMMDRRQ